MNNVYHLPNNSKFTTGARKSKKRKGGFFYLMAVTLAFPFVLGYLVIRQLMCDHEIMPVGTTYLKNGIKITTKSCLKCRKLYQGY